MMKKEKENAIFAVERYVSIAKMKAAYVKRRLNIMLSIPLMMIIGIVIAVGFGIAVSIFLDKIGY